MTRRYEYPSLPRWGHCPKKMGLPKCNTQLGSPTNEELDVKFGCTFAKGNLAVKGLGFRV